MFAVPELVDGVNCVCGQRGLPLLTAVRSKRSLTLVVKLLRAGADPRLCVNNRGTLLHIAVHLQEPLIVKALCKDDRVNVGAVDSCGDTAAHYLNDCATTRQLIRGLEHRGRLNVLETRNIEGRTPLIEVITKTGDIDVAFRLLATGAGVTIPDTNGDSVLHHLVAYRPDNGFDQVGVTHMIRYILQTYTPQQVATMYAAHSNRPTPMGLAFISNRPDLVDLFVPYGYQFSNADIGAIHNLAALARRTHGASASSSSSAESAFSALFKDVPKSGLGDERLAALPRIILSTTAQLEQHKTCTICYDEFEIGATAILLQCTHAFHTPCLERWLKNSTTCPVCRADLAEPAAAATTTNTSQ
jgi:hypothetical protein